MSNIEGLQRELIRLGNKYDSANLAYVIASGTDNIDAQAVNDLKHALAIAIDAVDEARRKLVAEIILKDIQESLDDWLKDESRRFGERI